MARNSLAATQKISISFSAPEQLITGFEDQLVGARAGEERLVRNVTFPAGYPIPDAKLADQPAEFTVHVKEVKAPDAMTLDDELAHKLGIPSLAALRSRVLATS